MQLSIALVQSLEELLQTAITRLTAEIKAETNPQRLETLLTLAFRARLPRIPPSPRTSPDPYREKFPSREPGEGRANDAVHQQPQANHPRANGAEHLQPQATPPGLKVHSPSLPPSPPLTPSPAPAPPSTPAVPPHPSTAADDEATADDRDPPLVFTPLTDDEFIKLQREIGYTEANRRRLIRAHLAARHPQTTLDSS